VKAVPTVADWPEPEEIAIDLAAAAVMVSV